MAAIQQMFFGGGVTATDPNYANVVALLHFNGSHGSTTFTDQKSNTWTLTGSGSAISTTDSKFGGSAMYFDGSDYIDSSSNAGYAFGTGDFTIEAWVNFDAAINNRFICGWHSNWGIYRNGSDLLVFNGASNAISATGVISAATWYHIALTRSGTSMRLFKDGTQVGSTATVSTNFTGTAMRMGGQTSGAGLMAGYVDDFRVTSGIARYTANFTAPSAPFPDA